MPSAIPRLRVIDMVTQGVANTFRLSVGFVGLYLVPWALGIAASVAAEAFMRENFGSEVLAKFIGDLAWAPFSAMAMVPMFRYALGEFRPVNWLHLEWSKEVKLVSIILLIWYAAAALLDHAQTLGYARIANALSPPSALNQASWAEFERVLNAVHFATYMLRNFLECLVVLCVIGMVPIAIVRKDFYVGENLRLVRAGPMAHFFVIAYAGLVIAAVYWLLWAKVVAAVNLPTANFALTTWREYIIYDYVQRAANFPSSLFSGSLVACLLALVWRHWTATSAPPDRAEQLS